jgi:hypothetical protein
VSPPPPAMASACRLYRSEVPEWAQKVNQALSLQGKWHSIPSAPILRQRMTDDRIDKLRAVVETSIGLARSLENQVAAHQLTHDEALERFRTAAHVPAPIKKPAQPRLSAVITR